MSKQDAIEWIRSIQNGEGVDRTKFPDSLKGSCAVMYWNRPEFTYGIEYGVMIALMEAFSITDGDLKGKRR